MDTTHTADPAAQGDGLRGAEKKEAFHQAAEAGIHSFKLEVPDMDTQGKKVHIKLAGTDSCRAAVQVLRNGGENNLHYHSNGDSFWMVLKGRIRFYGPDDMVIGEYGPQEGLITPIWSRYWFENAGEEDAEILHISARADSAIEHSGRTDLAEQRFRIGTTKHFDASKD